MKKNTFLALTLIAFFIFPVLGLAIEQIGEQDVPVTPTAIVAWIASITQTIFYGVMVIAVLFILVAAFHFLTASGNPEKIATARQMLIYAVIGIAVALLAYAIPFIVEGIITT